MYEYLEFQIEQREKIKKLSTRNFEKTQNAKRRKQKILKDIWKAEDAFGCKNLSKVNLSCGCPICSNKTQRKGWSAADIRNMSKGDEDGVVKIKQKGTGW